MVTEQVAECVGEFLQRVLKEIRTQQDYQSVLNLRPLLRRLEPDTDGYYYAPGELNEDLYAPYHKEPLRTLLLSKLEYLRKCGDPVLTETLRDLCGVEPDKLIREVRIRSWVETQLRALSGELANADEVEPEIERDLAALLIYKTSLSPHVVEALTNAHGAVRSDRTRIKSEIRRALRLLRNPDHPEMDVRGVE